MSVFMDPRQISAGNGKTICLTGAGCSQSAGIPTFAEQPGLRDKLSVEYMRTNYYDFFKTIQMLKKAIDGKEPTTAHKLIAQQKDWRVITMNIDSLHEKAGTIALEVHRNLKNVICSGCKRRHSIATIDTSYYCPSCGAKLQSPIWLYGDGNIPEYKTATQMLQLASTVIIIGTSFETGFSSEFLRIAKELGKEIHIFNENADAQLTEYLANRDLDNMF